MPQIIKITSLERDLQYNIIDDTRQEWLSELDSLNERYTEEDNDTSMVDDVAVFINQSVPGESYQETSSDGDFGFELRNTDGQIYGTMWDNYKNDYDCLIEPLLP